MGKPREYGFDDLDCEIAAKLERNNSVHTYIEVLAEIKMNSSTHCRNIIVI